ncbi:hypothetical protein FIBSPDRAFT_882362 [Athelia psychrophila]|uniref:Zinc-finger domain-containing protein n=1 Tax=Athelia psychrophila TaxID=1759441 RepID=A0A166V9J9_9AGAM|nr:hypothetical protein FIBSPDRAFT_882362 [Fibularhizoctonia sp. CBS 109695]
MYLRGYCTGGLKAGATWTAMWTERENRGRGEYVLARETCTFERVEVLRMLNNIDSASKGRDHGWVKISEERPATSGATTIGQRMNIYRILIPRNTRALSLALSSCRILISTVYEGHRFHPRRHYTKLLSGNAQEMSTAPTPPPSTTNPSVNVQTAPIRTVKKPKVITAKKPRKEDLLNAVRMAIERERGPQSHDTQYAEVRTVKKPIMQRSAQGISSSAEGPSEMGESDPDNGSDVSTGKAGSSHVRPRRVPGAMHKAVNKSVNRQSASEPNSKTYCHQCRNRNLHPKMRNCINTRYPQIQFNENAYFVCPKCSGCCNCSACAMARGDVYLPSRRGGRTNDSIMAEQSEHSTITESYATNDPVATGYYSTLFHVKTGEEIGTGFTSEGLNKQTTYFYTHDVKREEVD